MKIVAKMIIFLVALSVTLIVLSLFQAKKRAVSNSPEGPAAVEPIK